MRRDELFHANASAAMNMRNVARCEAKGSAS